MKFDFDSSNPAEVAAVHAAVTELMGRAAKDWKVSPLEAAVAAAQNEADKAAAALSRENGVFESAASEAVQVIEAAIAAVSHAEDLDSDGHAWNPELHASTKSKNADGTWKKRRGTAQAAAETVAQDDAATLVPVQPAPPAPPAPAAPTAEPIMPKIFALITSQIVTINQAVEAAQAEGFADLGANGLGGAPREAQEAVLRKLEGE